MPGVLLKTVRRKGWKQNEVIEIQEECSGLRAVSVVEAGTGKIKISVHAAGSVNDGIN